MENQGNLITMDEPITRFRQAASGQIEKVALQETGVTWILPR